MTQRTIDLDAFIRLLDGQVDEGDNGILYLDKSGIRSSIAPSDSEHKAIGLLFSAEKAILRRHECDVLLAFPCTHQQVRDWLKRNPEFKCQRTMRKINYLSRKRMGFDPLDGIDEQVAPAEERTESKLSVQPRTNKVITDEALDHYDQLRAKRTPWFNAAMETIAVERFNLGNINPGSLKTKSNQRLKKRREQREQLGNS